MLSSLWHFITIQIIYRPFFNILVLIYNNLPWGQDMGLALITFTLLINLLLLPLTLRGEESEEEKRELLNEIAKVEKNLAGYPIRVRKERDKLIKSHRKVIGSRYVSYAIYVCYFIVLWRVFKTGLKGEDLDLLYSFVSTPELPINLNFFGLMDLTKPSQLLNAASAILTIPAELMGIIFSDLPATRDDWMAVFIAPFAAFFITYVVPSGQELYFSTSLIFIMIVMITRQIYSIFVNKSKD